MTKGSKGNSRKVSEETQIKHAIDFIEELSWLIESKRSLKLNSIPKLLRSLLTSRNSTMNISEKYASPNPNIHYLIGVLPRLFQDKKLFTRNEDIASFAKDVLGVSLNRVEKRSRYELVGRVVCECNSLDDTKLEDMVSALAIITGNAEKIDKFVEERNSTGFSWNETIRKLAN